MTRDKQTNEEIAYKLCSPAINGTVWDWELFKNRIKEALDLKDSEAEELQKNGRIESVGEYFKIRPGIQKGKIWIESTGGEGGDFDQEELFIHIRNFYDTHF